MTRKLVRVGNSLGVILPVETLRLLGVEGGVGAEVDMVMVGRLLVIHATGVVDEASIRAAAAYFKEEVSA